MAFSRCSHGLLSLKGQEPHFGGMPHRQTLPEWKVWTRRNPHLGRGAHRQEGMLTSSSLSSEEAGPLMPAAGCPGFLSLGRCPGPTCFALSWLRGAGVVPVRPVGPRSGRGRGRTTRIPATLGSAGDKRHFLFWGPCGASPCTPSPLALFPTSSSAASLQVPPLCLAATPSPFVVHRLRQGGVGTAPTIPETGSEQRRRQEAAFARPHRRSRLSVALGRQPRASLSPSPAFSARRRGAARQASSDWLRESGRRSAIGPRGCLACECARWGGGAGSCWKSSGRAA